jgi:hypothetical protein
MVKGKKSKTPSRRSKRRAPQRLARTVLDGQAIDYAKLLLDPCGARLTHPVYSGGEGGYIVRTETFTTYFNGAGITAGVFHWTPGAINSDNTELLFTNVANGTTAAAATASALGPGKSFLANTSVARCVAACVKVGYSGSESSRAGRIHYGRTSASLINSGESVVPHTVMGALPYYSRTPVTELEVLWIPNDADQLFTDPNAPEGPQDRRRHAAITIAASSLPSDVGLTFRMTAIYEWQPSNDLGLAVPANSRATSNSTLDQVVTAVQSTLNGAASLAGVAVGNMAGNFARSAVGSLMGGVYGLMPTFPTTRSNQYLLTN